MQVLFQLVFSAVAAQGFSSDEVVVVSNSAEYLFNDYVYVGSDVDMPYNSSFYLALPPRDEGKPHPASIEEAFHEMKEMLPNWYLSALVKGRGEHECDVSVNGESYVAIVDLALAVWWDMDNDESIMRESLRKAGVKSDHPMIYMSALSRGFCIYLKEGAEAGVNEIKGLFSE